MPPKKKSVVPKRTIADVEAEYLPQLDTMNTHLEHMRWESNRLESLGEALDMDLTIARDRSVRDAGRLEAMREVHAHKRLSDEALQSTINAQCEELSGTAFIKARRVGMLKEERDQLRKQLDALKAKSDADSWEQGDIDAAQEEIARLVSEVSEAQRRSQRYVRALGLAKGLEDRDITSSSSYFPPTTTATTQTSNHGPLQLAVFAPPTTTPSSISGGISSGAPTCPVAKLVCTLVDVCGFARCDQPPSTSLLKDLRRLLLLAKSNCALVVVVHAFLRRRPTTSTTATTTNGGGLWEASLMDDDSVDWVPLDRILLAAMTEGECNQVTLIIEGRASSSSGGGGASTSTSAPLGLLISKQPFLAGKRDLSVVVEYNAKNAILEAALHKFIHYHNGGDHKSYTPLTSTPYHGGLIAQVLSHILLHSVSATVAANESSLPALVAQCLRAAISGGNKGVGSLGRLLSPMDRSLSCPPILCLPAPFLRTYLLSGVVGDNGAAQEQHPLEGGLLEMLAATTMGTMPMPLLHYTPIPWSWVSPGRHHTTIRTNSTSRSLQLKHALIPAYTDSLAGSRLQCLLAEREELWDHIADRIRQGGGGGSRGGPPSISVRPNSHNTKRTPTTTTPKSSLVFSGSFLEGNTLAVLIVPLSSATTSSGHPLMSPSTALTHLETMLAAHEGGIDSMEEDGRPSSSVVMMLGAIGGGEPSSVEANVSDDNSGAAPIASIGETRRKRRLQGLVGDLQARVRRGIDFEVCALHTETIQTLAEGIRGELAPLLIDQTSDWEDEAHDANTATTTVDGLLTSSDANGAEMQRLVQVECVQPSGVDPSEGILLRVDISGLDTAERAHLAASIHHYALVELQASPPLFLVSDIRISASSTTLLPTNNTPTTTTVSILEDTLPGILTYTTV